MQAFAGQIRVGIEGLGIYLPEHRHTAAFISERSGVPRQVLETKFGLKSKAVPGPGDHTVAMAARAAETAIERAGVNPEDIDLVIWAGEVHAERPMQTYGIKLQNEVGATRAWAFDINQRCGTFMLAMSLAKSQMATDPACERVLIASGYRNCDLIDYSNPRSRFMFNLAAGGAAVLLRRNHKANIILETSRITDGRFADDVYVPGGGTVIPLTTAGGGHIPASANRVLKDQLGYLDVPDPEGMKKRLDKLSMSNFIRVVDESLERSGYQRKDIDYLGLLHMKDSAFRYVSEQLGVDPEKQTTYYDEFVHLGHMGQNDGIVAIEMGLKHKKIHPGSLVVLAAAGIGYAWNATTIKWG
ncbi:MAG: 3-oxoacyl-ACP synthase [Deltaproteobacteria bacterium]|nr:3-oxoacyl-ACP synthase [Deltaproteobacteria bacterium]